MPPLDTISSVESRPLSVISYAVLILSRFVTLHNMLAPISARRRRYCRQPQTKQTWPSPNKNSPFNFNSPIFILFAGQWRTILSQWAQISCFSKIALCVLSIGLLVVSIILTVQFYFIFFVSLTEYLLVPAKFKHLMQHRAQHQLTVGLWAIVLKTREICNGAHTATRQHDQCVLLLKLKF
jgi:hypothetical protein